MKLHCLIVALLQAFLLQAQAQDGSPAKFATQVKVTAYVEGFDLDQAVGHVVGSETSHLNLLPPKMIKSGTSGTIKTTRELPVPTEWAADGKTPVTFETLQLGIVLTITPHLKDGKISYAGVLRLGHCFGPLKNSGKGVTLVQSKTYFHDIVASGESASFDAATPDGKPAQLTIKVEALDSGGKAIEE